MTRTLGAVAVLLACLSSACGASGSDGAHPSPTSASTSTSTSGSGSATRPAPASGPSSAAISASTARATARAAAAGACAGNERGKLVLVRIRVQHLWMCQGSRTVRDTAVTTGVPGENTHTPTGRYRVQTPAKNTVLTLASGQTYDVKFWIPFDAPLFGFHDSRWQKFPYGSARYRTDGSHGCVHVPLAAIRFLFGWVEIGTRVHITA